jgi:hypothetical protein
MITIEDIKRFCKRFQSEKFEFPERAGPYSVWEKEEIEKLNKQYNVEKFIPGYVAIGTNEGGEILVIKTDSGSVYSIPAVPIDENQAILLTKDFNKLQSYIKNSHHGS